MLPVLVRTEHRFSNLRQHLRRNRAQYVRYQSTRADFRTFSSSRRRRSSRLLFTLMRLPYPMTTTPPALWHLESEVQRVLVAWACVRIFGQVLLDFMLALEA